MNLGGLSGRTLCFVELDIQPYEEIGSLEACFSLNDRNDPVDGSLQSSPHHSLKVRPNQRQ